MERTLKDLSLEELWVLFPVQVVPYCPDWMHWYQQEKRCLQNVVGSQLLRLHHIGSTSVPGLDAKPTVDILMEIKNDCDCSWLVNILENIGYIYEPQPQKPAPHMMLMKGYTLKGFADKVFHLHVRYKGDWDEIYFRNYLQKHSETAKAYAALKHSLQAKFTNDRDAYTKAKTAFVQEYTRLGRIEAQRKF